MSSVSVGSIVKYREREWVVLPSEDPDIILLRPLGGSNREICGVHRDISSKIGYELPFERVKPANFPLPTADLLGDHVAVRLFFESARLLLREGAAPFRSLGHISVRPRPYQFVPLLMALRLNPVRILIADDVGVGKTIEAALIARELLDRGEIKRIAVLSPPYLCDQWEKELREKFHIEPVVIRSGTVAKLERRLPPDKGLFEYYPHIVASIDLVKSERYRNSFIIHCPEFLIVDEVHGAAQPPGGRRSKIQQQRHELLRELARDPHRHLILLTATPHSGIEESFLSILGLLKEEFRELDLSHLTEDERKRLALHFVQRRRADVKNWMGEETPFPERENEERPYNFSREYRELYEDVYEFARGLVKSAEELKGWKRRMRFWSALALLRCITSSPEAARVALERRAAYGERAGVEEEIPEEELDQTFEPIVYDPSEIESVVDSAPSAVFDEQEKDPDFPQSDRRLLRSFARRAEQLRGPVDLKLQELVKALRELLVEGYQPIVWCRYIATANYVAEQVRQQLANEFHDLQVISVTGESSEEERRMKVEELAKSPRRILVATDCLSEGINLQEHFTAVIHYDLPWNPNRLEQREGRVDRFGQPAKKVKAILIYGRDNPVDGAVLDVLLRKAREIRRDLGISVPLPVDSESVIEAVLNSLFFKAKYTEIPQLSLFEMEDVKDTVSKVHKEWIDAAHREKESRTRFAQRAIKPDEVARELKETDAVLGSPEDVKNFLLEASQRVGFYFRRIKDEVYELKVSDLPSFVKQRLSDVSNYWKITFQSPTPEGVTFIGRNHPLIEGLSEYLMDRGLNPVSGHDNIVARTGVIRTDQVKIRTTLFLLRMRYKVLKNNGEESLAEETIVWGYRGLPPTMSFIPHQHARELFDKAKPTQNVPLGEKREVIQETLANWDNLQDELKEFARDRASDLQESYRRLRKYLGKKSIQITPHYPPDLLGILVLLPQPEGI